MPKGHYAHRTASITSLRNELMAIGAETRYRELLDQQRDLLKAFPALRKLQIKGREALDLILPPAAPDTGAGPAPEALQLFHQHKAKQAASQAPALPRLPKKKRYRSDDLAPYLRAALDQGPQPTSALLEMLQDQGVRLGNSQVRKHLSRVPGVMRTRGGRGSDVVWTLKAKASRPAKTKQKPAPATRAQGERGPGKKPTLVDKSVEILRETGQPMSALAVASALWERGWRPKTSDTDQKRGFAVAVILRRAIVRKQHPDLLVNTKSYPALYRVRTAS